MRTAHDRRSAVRLARPPAGTQDGRAEVALGLEEVERAR